MIIDQLTPVTADNLTDELPVEQGTTTFKTTLQKIRDLFDGYFSTKLVEKSVTLESGADLDTVIASGFYRVQSSPVNAPSGANPHSQLIVSRGGDTIAQIYCDYMNSKMFVRTANNITTTPNWQAWKEMLFADGSNISSVSAWQSLLGIDVNDVLYFTNVPCTAMTGNFVEYFSSLITSNHVLAAVQFAKPSAISPYLTWNTSGSNQRLRINGTCSEATTCNILLIKKDN